ncbi:MAG TPA: DUF116 domain-containing protein [Dissulfurispiraceae bacterium]|nr:DUF116 domain-containing protein [Dissulfurispiraceae bacterium]
MVLKIIYPTLMLVSSFAKGKREAVQLWTIRANNRLVDISSLRARSVLLLLPHCLQISDCEVRITHNIRNCKRCGRCSIKDLIGIAEEFDLSLFVATGGTVARRVVQEARPDVIVAVACERDLSSGIVDTYPMPVIGILNDRPHGPCLNTAVDLAKVREALIRIVRGSAR